MKIAVNTRFLLDEYLEGYGYFIYEVFRRITRNHPEHEFLFIFDRPFDKRFIFEKNVKGVVVGPAARHPILWKLWYDVKIPAVLKRHKADLFISCDGFCSLATNLPQCLVIHDLAWLHYPSFIPGSHLFYLKHFTPRFLQKAGSIATVSEFSKKDILGHYGVSPGKIDVVYSSAKEIFLPLDASRKASIKEKYTRGREFFLYTGAIHPRKNLFNLLKAFSLLKKRLKSNICLVLAGRLAWKYQSFTSSLKTYKYREDVILTGYLPESELALVTGAAYALVYPSLWEGFGVPVIEALRCEVPVITSLGTAMQEIAGDAALYANPESFHDLADKMILLYKDENLRASLVNKGKQVEPNYSWDRTAGLLWQSVLKAMYT